MALASFASADDADDRIRATVDRILSLDTLYPAPKAEFEHSLIYNAGIEAASTKIAAALMTERLFSRFAETAQAQLPKGIPLRISGGCGLNCHWNQRWRQLGHFCSVFVPPCTNDSGSAVGTAIDAFNALTGNVHIRWNVYSGLEFEHDAEPSTVEWRCDRLDNSKLADRLALGQVVAWVQGRWEIGPRALGNRSLLAEPFKGTSRERLNRIKEREKYRPIAPCCRIEEVARFFEESYEDPYMLYARRVRSDALLAVTHVDKSARLQTVSRDINAPLYELLSAFSARAGAGVLCNTSLNFKGLGFINRMSDLIAFCESKGIENMVVNNMWYQRRQCRSSE